MIDYCTYYYFKYIIMTDASKLNYKLNNLLACLFTNSKTEKNNPVENIVDGH